MSALNKAGISLIVAVLLMAGMLTTMGQINNGGSGGGGLPGSGTNPYVATSTLQVPNGTISAPSYTITGFTTTGMYVNTNYGLVLTNGGADIFGVGSNTAKFTANIPIQWQSTTSPLVTSGFDTGISRSAAGVLAVGSGTQADTTGKVKASGYMSVGTKFTSNAGCTESALTGGATAGKFTVGQNTACTIIITMGDSATAPNGWACAANDQTAVPAVAIRQTASNATTASLLMTVATSDVVSFHCVGY